MGNVVVNGAHDSRLVLMRGSRHLKQIVSTKGIYGVGMVLLAALISPADSTAGPVVEQRIERIRNALLPPVLVQGESTPSTSLASRMESLHVPGVSVAVIHGGKLEWARGFGVTKIGGPPVTPETLFQAASITKPVTTLAVMSLVQSGKLDLDTDVNQYLKSWKVPTNEFTLQAKVTLRGLLTHSAGITVHGFRGYAADQPIPTLLQVLNGEPPANSPAIRVDTVPGKTWRYSGGGFVIAQQVLTDVTGVAFPKLMQDLILRPLRMTYSTYDQPLPPKLLSNAATPYRADGTAVQGGPHIYPELGPAGLWTTPSDLAKYAIGIQEALSGKSRRPLSAATARAMLVPAYNQQALGLVVGGSNARKYFNHGGANFGYRCLLVAYQDGDGAVVMTNSDNGDPLIREIIRTVAHEYVWPDYAPPVRTLATIDPTSFDSYVGAYRFVAGSTVTFWRDGDHFKNRIFGQAVVEMFPTSEHEYFEKVVDARWTFPTADHLTVTLHQNNREQVVERLGDTEGRAALDFSRATEKRFLDQTARPESEAALRRLITGLANGTPNYDEMVPAFAEVNRQELPMLQAAITRLGALQSMSFKSVGAAGQDIYDVQFEHGSREFRILLESDGRIHAAEFSP
jgi:CubicO group peptidase (beta-lactamase class C family)